MSGLQAFLPAFLRYLMADDQIKELHPAPKRPFVELVVASADGTVLNTISGENPELAKLLPRLADVAETSGFPIKKLDPLMPLGQDIFKLDRALLLMLLGCLYSKTWAEVQAMPKNFPETAVYTIIVSY